jgi:hypothetical protein
MGSYEERETMTAGPLKYHPISVYDLACMTRVHCEHLRNMGEIPPDIEDIRLAITEEFDDRWDIHLQAGRCDLSIGWFGVVQYDTVQYRDAFEAFAAILSTLTLDEALSIYAD